MDPKATNVSTVRVKKWRLGSFLFLQRLKLVLPDMERERERERESSGGYSYKRD
jgi:hypothetical protein